MYQFLIIIKKWMQMILKNIVYLKEHYNKYSSF